MPARSLRVVGTAPLRLDAHDKVTGKATFLSDLRVEGLWEAVVVTTTVPHGILKSIEIPSVPSSEGLVLVARDIPGVNQIGIVQQDQEFMATGRVRSLAERIALVAAPSLDGARRIAEQIRCQIEPLPVVDDPEFALNPEAPLIHASGNVVARLRVVRGDADAAFGRADLAIENVFRTGYQEHAYLEPQGAVAVPGTDGRMTIHSTCQCPFYIKSAVAKILGLPQSQVRVCQTVTGGAFGGKEDYPSEVAAGAALLALKMGRPVRLAYDRSEDFRWTSKRHRTVIRHRLAALRSGKILGMRVEIIYDAGAYSGLSVVVAERGNSSACGPYEIEAVDVHTRIVYTNNLFTGAYRGFGAPQVTFATERQIDELAGRLTMDPKKIREINLWKRGSITASGETLTGIVPMRRTFRKALDLSEYKKRQRALSLRARDGRHLRGIGLAASYYGNNLHNGGEHLDRSQAWVGINPDGSINVAVGLTEMGQGLLTAVAQIVAEELGVGIERIRVGLVDTDIVQDSGPTVASRGTIMSGMPARAAAGVLKRRMQRAIGEATGHSQIVIEQGVFRDRKSHEELMSWEDGVAYCYARRVEMAALGYYKPPERSYDPATGQGKPYATNSYTTHVAEVEVDRDTGLVRVVRVTAVHDVGRAINLQGIKGQIEGGIAQGAGLALWEELVTSGGILLNPGFTDYAIPSIADVPEVRWGLVEHPWKEGPFGAKGIGEPSLIGVPAAIANAVSNAIGKPVYEIPLTPERVLRLLEG